MEGDGLYVRNASAPKHNDTADTLIKGPVTGTVPLLAQLSDLVAGAGLSQAVAVTDEDEAVSEECVDKDICLKSFTALTGGHMHYSADFRTDMNSLSLLSGLAWGQDVPLGRLTLGAFLEYGAGSYTTCDTFPDLVNIGDDFIMKGDGLAWHLGGGLLGRLNLTGTGKRGSHAYAEGSLRAGQMNNHFSHSHMVMGRPELIEFDTSAPYYGAHLGLGYLWKLSEATSLDIYGKYLWARQEGDSIILDSSLDGLKDPIDFKAVDSHRLQGGFRLTRAVTEKASPYIGAAYDYEFDTIARATTYGMSIDSHDLAGGTWMGELGVKLKTTAALPAVLDLSLSGYTGLREGVTGSIQFRVEF
jgi:outer membrane autotransporter protein